MTLPPHLLLGMIIGKVTGNYPVAIASSVLIDLDHLQSDISRGLITKPRKLWNTLIDQNDPYGDQRGIFHNYLFFLIIATSLIIFTGKIGIVITLGYLGHLLLDTLDNSDYWPLYPNKRINLRGPINYATWKEGIFFVGLIIIFFII